MKVYFLILAIVSLSAGKPNGRVKRQFQEIFYEASRVPTIFGGEEIIVVENELSAPGCPSSLQQGIPWLYFGTGDNIMCYVMGSTGPCGRGQVFTPLPGNPNTGYCNCDCPLGETTTALSLDENGPAQFCTGHRRREDGKEVIVESKFVFIPERKQCFELFSQEFCNDGEWLVRTPDNQHSCETRKCPEGHHAYGENDGECSQPGLVTSVWTGLSNEEKCTQPGHVKHEGHCIKQLNKPKGFS